MNARVTRVRVGAAKTLQLCFATIVLIASGCAAPSADGAAVKGDSAATGRSDSAASVATHTPSTTAAEPSAAITLERGSCRGGCTPYRVTLNENGRVTFAHLDGAAAHQDSVAPASIATLIAAMQNGGFISLDSVLAQGAPGCGAYAMDAPTAVLTLTSGGASHTVRHDYGCASLPASLRQWGSAVDSIARTDRWLSPSTGRAR